MQLHWTGNNDSVNERNLSAAFGTGATPSNVDHFADRADRRVAARRGAAALPVPHRPGEGEGRRGALLRDTARAVTARAGRISPVPLVGFVTPIEEVGTDRDHYDSYTYDCATVQNMIYAGTKYRFTHFRKTSGYANAPLDGIWLRAPYLHNGSVPTLRDLLEPPENRPKKFYRGYDVYRSGEGRLHQSVASESERRLRRVRHQSTKTRGNGGHLWGTELDPAQKDAIVEYMKTF